MQPPLSVIASENVVMNSIAPHPIPQVGRRYRVTLGVYGSRYCLQYASQCTNHSEANTFESVHHAMVPVVSELSLRYSACRFQDLNRLS